MKPIKVMRYRSVTSAPVGGGGGSIKSRLSSWWTFDNTMDDVHGANDMVNGDTPAYAAGKKGYANNNAKRYSNTPTGIEGFHTSGCSLFFWFHPTNTTARVIASLGRNMSGGEILSIDHVDGAFGAGYRDSAGASGPSRIAAALNSWHFVVASWDPSVGAIRLWMDGITSTGTKSAGSALTPQYFEAGSRYSYGWPLGGLMDEAGFVVGALSNDEIAWLYNGGAGRAYSDL